MNKIDILKELCNKRIMKISKEQFETNGERTYYTTYFKIDKDLNVYSYTREIDFDGNFVKRKDISLSKLIKHAKTLEKEDFDINFIDIVL